MGLALKLNTGVTIPLRETTGKNGHKFYAVRPPTETIVSRFGFNYPLEMVGGKLPSSAQVVLDGSVIDTIKFDSGTTSPNPNTGKGGGNAKVTGTSSELHLDNEVHVLKVRMSTPKATTANLLIRTARPTAGRLHDEF